MYLHLSVVIIFFSFKSEKFDEQTKYTITVCKLSRSRLAVIYSNFIRLIKLSKPTYSSFMFENLVGEVSLFTTGDGNACIANDRVPIESDRKDEV